jgi:archaellum component FlaF (FlaF/FlaG flagellin family)
MGFSLVGAAAIIGVSILMGIEIIISSGVPTIINVDDAFDEMRNRAIDQVQTDINITSVTSEVNGTGYDINITVENIGSVTLETTFFDILINGTKNDFSCSKSYIHPENEVYFNVSSLSGIGPRKLKVVTNNGISDYYEFTLP